MSEKGFTTQQPFNISMYNKVKGVKVNGRNILYNRAAKKENFFLFRLYGTGDKWEYENLQRTYTHIYIHCT